MKLKKLKLFSFKLNTLDHLLIQFLNTRFSSVPILSKKKVKEGQAESWAQAGTHLPYVGLEPVGG